MVNVSRASKWGVLLVAGTLVACVSNGPKPSSAKSSGMPDWVENEPNQSGHVYGVGSAPVYVDQAKALQQAQDAARVSMIQKLKVTVTGSLSQDIQETRRTGQATEIVKTVRNQITSRIPQAELDNLEVEENYVDKKNKVAYALVHLDRRRASSNLRQRIADLDMQVTSLSDRVPDNLATLKQLQGLMPALKWLSQREKLTEQLVLVDMNNRGVQKDEMLTNAEARINQLFDRLQVSLVAKNDAAKRVRAGLSKSLTDLGLRLGNSGADLTIEYSANLREVEKGGRYIVFADGQVDIKDGAGRVLSSVREEAKGVSAASMEQGRYKAVEQLGNKLGGVIAASFVSFID